MDILIRVVVKGKSPMFMNTHTIYNHSTHTYCDSTIPTTVIIKIFPSTYTVTLTPQIACLVTVSHFDFGCYLAVLMVLLSTVGAESVVGTKADTFRISNHV